MKSINLGRDYSEMDALAVPVKPEKKMSYPSLFLSDIEGLDMLATKGEAMIKYVMKSCTKRANDGDAEPSYSCDIEIMSITPITPKESDHGGESTSESENAMEKLLEGADE